MRKNHLFYNPYMVETPTDEHRVTNSDKEKYRNDKNFIQVVTDFSILKDGKWETIFSQPNPIPEVEPSILSLESFQEMFQL